MSQRTSPTKIQDEILAKEQKDETLEPIRIKVNKDRNGNWIILNEVIYRIRHNKRKRGKRRLQLVLPKGYREEIMEAYHDYPQAGHIGEFKTIESIAQKY